MVIKNILLYSIFILLFSNCGNNKNKVEINSTTTAQDSITTWIQYGRNANLSEEIRCSFLEKALTEANKKINDSIKLNYLSDLSYAYLNVDDSLKFRSANKGAIALSEKLNDSSKQALAHWDLGTFLRKQSIPDSSYFHFREAQQLFSAIGNQYYSGRMLYNMASVQADVKDYTGSEITTIKAIELLKPLDKYEQLYLCYNNLGIISFKLNDYDQALDNYDQALSYANKTTEVNAEKEVVFNNIGLVYEAKGQYENAISYYDQVLKTDGLLKKHAKLYATALNNFGRCKIMLDGTADVKEYLDRALQIRDSIDDLTGMSVNYYSLANYHLIQKDTALAIQHAQKAKTFAEQSSNNERLLETLKFLAGIDTKNSLTFSQRYIALNDSLLLEERKERNKFTRIRFETNEFIAENQLLTRKKQIWSGIAVGLFLFGASLYAIIDQRQKNQKLRFQQQQQTSNQEIFNLLLSQKQKVEEGRKMEQKRISEELHDGVLGKMLGARMVLTGLNKKTDEDAIRERTLAISALKDVEGEVRSISHELSNAAYDKIENFINSIKDLLNTVNISNSIDFNFSYDEEVNWDKLSGEIKINLYRIVQESLQNSIKHAKCKNILVNFKIESEILKVLIVDDGIGFKKARSNSGIGMRNISSRIKKLNGTWTVDSVIGEGTKLNLEIPIKYYPQDLPTTNELNNLVKV